MLTRILSIKKLLFVITILSVVASCKRVLDVNPDYDLDGSTRFNTIDDYDFSLQGAYSIFQSTSYYGSTDERANAWALLPDMLADNLLESGESLGNERVFSRWAYAEDETQIERAWLAAYRVITQANISLQGIEKFSATNAGAVNRIKGQALAMRAHVHFDILRYWVNDYDRNSGQPGIPYITRFDYEVKPARGTVKQTYDSIEKDLKAAKILLQNTDRVINNNKGNSRAYIDADVINAMLARMYLYSNQLDSAIKYSTLVINRFPLANMNDFPLIWTDLSNSEVIWSVTFEAGQGTPGNHAYFPEVDAAAYQPPPTLRASYDQSNDVRFASYYELNNGRWILSKYKGKQAQLDNDQPDGVVNFKVFRTGEMYLIRAEANARKGAANEAAALADLNTLRAARIFGYTPVAGLTGAALLNAIATERRKELTGEGHRFFDLKRTTRTVNRTDCTSFCTLSSTNRAWTWPIPKPEIDANPAILPQNPGY